MVAILLVLLRCDGWAQEREERKSANRQAQIPGDKLGLSVEVVAFWTNHVQSPGSAWAQTKRSNFLGKSNSREGLHAPRCFQELLEAGFKASPEKLLGCLDEMEAKGFYDPWLAAFYWRKSSHSAGSEKLALLYARLHRHTRIANSLIRAKFEVRPLKISPRAWMSKGGAGREVEAQYAGIVQMTENAERHFPKADASTWERDGIVIFKVTGKPLLLRRTGGRLELEPEKMFRFNRLDLLQTKDEAVLEHPLFGVLRLPDNAVVSVWELPGALSPQGQERVRELVDKAMAGNEKAAETLESALPLTQAAIREALEKSPAATGAARLRLILALFDDAGNID